MNAPLARLELTLPLPPSDNAAHKSAPKRGLINGRSPAMIAYMRAVALQVSSSGALPLVGEVHVRKLHIYFRQTGCDLANRFKVLNDALNGWAWLDDRQIDAIDDVRRRVDSRNPRVVMEIVGDRFATKEEARANRELRAETNRKRKVSARKTRAKKNASRLEAIRAHLSERARSATVAPRSSP